MTVNTVGSHDQLRPSRTVAEWLWPFIPMGISAFSLSALVYYHLRQDVFAVQSPLQQFYANLYRTIGLAPSVLFFLLVLTWSTIWLVSGRLERPISRIARLVAMAVLLGMFLNLGDGGVAPAVHKGELGAWFAETLVAAFGYIPSLVLVFVMTFASLLLATDFFFSERFERLRCAGTEPGPEVGVEAEVTEQLRRLAEVMPDPDDVPGHDGGGVGAPPLPVEPPAAAAEMRFTAPPAFADPDADARMPMRRRSYFERRQERYGEPVRGEDWAPAAPDNQEIDDPETRLADEAAAEAPAEPLADERAEERADEARPAPQAAAVDGAADADVVDLDDDLGAIDEDEDERDDEDTGEADADRDEELDRDDAGEDLLVRAEIEVPAPTRDAALEPTVIERPPSRLADVDEGSDVADVRAANADTDATAPPQEGPDEPDEFTELEERVVAIPRPEPTPAPAPPERAPEPVEIGASTPASHESPVASPAEQEGEPAMQQQKLFGGGVDEELIQEAVEVVQGARRASIALLQRKLRIDYALAGEVLAELAARGVVALDGDATQGRVLG